MTEEYKIEPKASEKMAIKYIIREMNEIISKNKWKTTEKAVNMLIKDEELKAMLFTTNAIIVDYLRYNDHGWAHSVITTKNAMKILSIIKDEIPPNIVAYKRGSIDDAAFVTAMGAFLHDIGNMIHRENHWIHSTVISQPIIWRYIKELYSDEPLNKQWQLYAHIQNAIFSHDERIQAFTIEASIVKVADGCDMAAGRSRRPYSIGKVDIHSVSALSITEVEFEKGSIKPLKVIVNMTNPSGIFQVEEVLMPKLRTSLLYEKTEIETLVNGKHLKLKGSPIKF